MCHFYYKLEKVNQCVGARTVGTIDLTKRTAVVQVLLCLRSKYIRCGNDPSEMRPVRLSALSFLCSGEEKKKRNEKYAQNIVELLKQSRSLCDQTPRQFRFFV